MGERSQLLVQSFMQRSQLDLQQSLCSMPCPALSHLRHRHLLLTAQGTRWCVEMMPMRLLCTLCHRHRRSILTETMSSTAYLLKHAGGDSQVRRMKEVECKKNSQIATPLVPS